MLVFLNLKEFSKHAPALGHLPCPFSQHSVCPPGRPCPSAQVKTPPLPLFILNPHPCFIFSMHLVSPDKIYCFHFQKRLIYYISLEYINMMADDFAVHSFLLFFPLLLSIASSI